MVMVVFLGGGFHLDVLLLGYGVVDVLLFRLVVCVGFGGGG